MAKIEITRTELVWPGKYNEDGTLKDVPRVSLPFQVIETVNESRATRETQKTKGFGLFDVCEGKEGATFEEGWRNKLIWGDNLLVMGSLLEKFAGKIDLIYIDPPFATGADFSFTAEIGESLLRVEKDRSVLEEKAYRDTWGSGLVSYLEMMAARVDLIRALWHRFWSGADRPTMRYELLGETPSHGQWKWERERALHAVANYNKYLKEAAGRSLVEYWRNTGEQLEIIRKSAGGTVESWFPPSDEKVGDTVWDDVKAYENQEDYATQKHEELLDRIVTWLSQTGDLVADFFCGSGTTLAVAEKRGRRWIGCDLGRWAIHVTRKRLLGIENCKPFEVLNLGKYERQYWQGVTFGEAKEKSLTEQAIYEYLAFILKLYGAQPVAGSS